MTQGLFFEDTTKPESAIERAAKEWYKHYSAVVDQVNAGKTPNIEAVGEAQMKLIEAITQDSDTKH